MKLPILIAFLYLRIGADGQAGTMSFYDLCLSAPCRNDGSCVSNSSSFTCTCRSGFSGTYCQTSTTNYDERGCPLGDDEPYTECIYNDVCQFPYASCPTSRGDIRCLVNHCGGCHPVYVDSRGIVIDCDNRTVLQCPTNLARQTSCLGQGDPCLTATCPVDPSAKCVSQPCGGCTAEFYDEFGDHINCSTGQTSTCPEGLDMIVFDEAHSPCERTFCPAHPKASCIRRRCNGRHDSHITNEFYDANAKLLHCNKTVYSDVCISGFQKLRCLNGATCVPTSEENGFTCICPFPYEGASCEYIIPDDLDYWPDSSAKKNGELAVKIVIAGVCVGAVVAGVIIGLFKYRLRHKNSKRHAASAKGDEVNQVCMKESLYGDKVLLDKGDSTQGGPVQV